MKKILFFLLVIASLFMVAADNTPEIITWDRPHADQVYIKADKWICSADFSGEVPIGACWSGLGTVIPAKNVTIQISPERINNGYYIIIVHDDCGTGTTVVAYNPDADSCRVFLQTHLFE